MKMPLDDLRRTEHCREGTQRRQAFSQHARWSALQPLAATRSQPIVSARCVTDAPEILRRRMPRASRCVHFGLRLGVAAAHRETVLVELAVRQIAL